MRPKNYKDVQNIITNENYNVYTNSQKSNYNLNQYQKNNSYTETPKPSLIIYDKESRVCPLKGNNFYYQGVS